MSNTQYNTNTKTAIMNTTTDEQPTPSRLMLLPAELRLNIYEYVVNDIAIHQNRIRRPRSLFTCRLILKELLPVYASHLHMLQQEVQAQFSIHLQDLVALKNFYRPGWARDAEYRGKWQEYLVCHAEREAVRKELKWTGRMIGE